MDAAAVRFLNAGVGAFPPFDRLMEAFASDYLVPVAGSLVLLGLWLAGPHADRMLNQIATMSAAGAIGAANAATSIFNAVIDRPRPFAEIDGLALLFYRPTDPSFPSNSASVGFALATAAFLRHRKLGAALYALAFLWAFARVYGGVHYPTDVLAGAAIGAASGVAAWAAFRLFAFAARAVLRAMRRVYAA